jgi:Tfp pilus assembly protein PilW
MRRVFFIAVLGLMILGFAPTAQAVTDFSNAPQGAHYAKGFGEPVCTVSGTTVTCTGTQIEGVGNTNATVELAVTSTISGVCHNPGVNSMVVEPFSESITTTTSSELTSTKNGRLVVPAQMTEGTSTEEFLATFTCPNPNWTPEVTSNVLSFTYTLTFAGFTEPAILITG